MESVWPAGSSQRFLPLAQPCHQAWTLVHTSRAQVMPVRGATSSSASHTHTHTQSPCAHHHYAHTYQPPVSISPHRYSSSCLSLSASLPISGIRESLLGTFVWKGRACRHSAASRIPLDLDFRPPIRRAQQLASTFRLSRPDKPHFELVGRTSIHADQLIRVD